MDLFAFPAEIRLLIYSELLLHHGTISFPATSLRYPHWIDLCLDLLHVNKQVYGEAISILYSGNYFRFSPDVASTQCHTALAAFVLQIGARSRLIRHVCVEDCGHDPGFQACIGNLDLLRDACPGMTTLEISLRADPILHNSPVFAKSLDLIDSRLGAFQALQKFKVDVELSDWD